MRVPLFLVSQIQFIYFRHHQLLEVSAYRMNLNTCRDGFIQNGKQEDSRLDYSYYALEATLKPYPPETEI